MGEISEAIRKRVQVKRHIQQRFASSQTIVMSATRIGAQRNIKTKLSNI